MSLTKSCTPTAFLLGAFDRFNYGDLLFPLVVRNALALVAPNVNTAIHALIESDLTQYGALRTNSLRTLYRPGVLQPGDAVIFAGGGTIGVDWAYMYANLLGKTGNAALYYLKRLIGEQAVDRLCRHIFRAHAPFPWVAAPEDFPVPVKVAYNAVGGSEFARLPRDIQKRTLQYLGKATYLSVRDMETKRLLSPLEQHNCPVALAPDSAILMSEQFPVPWLEAQARQGHRQLIDAEPYLCFQSNLHYAKRHSDEIVTALESIHQTHGLRAVLLPIGRYVGLDDQVALSRIQDKLRTPCNIVSDKATIHEIMLTIARASLFLGTSLHGNITSQSFAIPHLGLSNRPCKVDFYLDTWDLPEQSRCAPLAELKERVAEVLAVPESARLEKRKYLIAKSHENFAMMAHACGLTNNSATANDCITNAQEAKIINRLYPE